MAQPAAGHAGQVQLKPGVYFRQQLGSLTFLDVVVGGRARVHQHVSLAGACWAAFVGLIRWPHACVCVCVCVCWQLRICEDDSSSRPTPPQLCGMLLSQALRRMPALVLPAPGGTKLGAEVAPSPKAGGDSTDAAAATDCVRFSSAGSGAGAGQGGTPSLSSCRKILSLALDVRSLCARLARQHTHSVTLCAPVCADGVFRWWSGRTNAALVSSFLHRVRIFCHCLRTTLPRLCMWQPATTLGMSAPLLAARCVRQSSRCMLTACGSWFVLGQPGAVPSVVAGDV